MKIGICVEINNWPCPKSQMRKELHIIITHTVFLSQPKSSRRSRKGMLFLKQALPSGGLWHNLARRIFHIL
jgi:hypothetical protein